MTTLRFDCKREHEQEATGKFFYCGICLTDRPISERTQHKIKEFHICKQCVENMNQENKGYGRELSVEELNAKFLGDLPAQWGDKPESKPRKERKVVKGQMRMDLQGVKSGLTMRVKNPAKLRKQLEKPKKKTRKTKNVRAKRKARR